MVRVKDVESDVVEDDEEVDEEEVVVDDSVVDVILVLDVELVFCDETIIRVVVGPGLSSVIIEAEGSIPPEDGLFVDGFEDMLTVDEAAVVEVPLGWLGQAR
jgi:hypothetical protein